MVSLTIDGKTVSVPAEATILEAAREAGVSIPTLCWLQKVSPTGACRICAVEVEGVDRPMTACNTVVKEGISVTTRSAKLDAIRKQIVELLLINHPLDCPVCDAGGECELQDVCYGLDVDRQPFEAEDVNHGTIDHWPLIQQVPNRCILCEKCVKVCHEVVGSSCLFVNDQGDRAFIDKDVDLCEFCGNCVSVCPTGTMISKPFKFRARPWELTNVPSVCTHCGSQCQIEFNVKQNEVYRVTSEDGVTVNDGNLCNGGFFGYGYVHSEARLTRPQVKKDGVVQPASWEEALGAVAERIKAIRQTGGGQAMAGLASARFTNEENYLFQKFFRVAVGSNNIDSDARFGALRALRGLDRGLGLKGASNLIGRIGKADAVLVFGSDVTAEAPAIDWQIENACRRRHGKLVVANMRRVKLTRYSESFLHYRAGSEIHLANALSKVILDKGLADESYLNRFVENLDELKAHLGKVDLDAAAAETGLPRQAIEEAACYLGNADSVAVIFGGDVTRSELAEEKSAAVANLALIAGALHGEEGGLFPVDERGNTQGLLDMGVYPESLPGYQEYRQHRERFGKIWGAELPEGGKDAIGILEGIEAGDIRFLYLAATDPLVSFPEAARWRKALEKVEFLVVQDIFSSELTKLADVVLPGVSAAEKSGSFTSLDNRIGCLAQAIAPLGEAREDWRILADLYTRAGRNDRPLNLEAVLSEIREVVPLYSDVCFTAGSGRCRPCLKAPYAPEEKNLRYVPVDGTPVAEGMQLLTGKILFQFGTTTTRSKANLEVAPTGYIEIHPEDAAASGLADGDRAEVKSSLGAATAPVLISPNVPRGLVFAPYHFAEPGIQRIIPQGSNRAAVQLSKA